MKQFNLCVFLALLVLQTSAFGGNEIGNNSPQPNAAPRAPQPADAPIGVGGRSANPEGAADRELALDTRLILANAMLARETQKAVASFAKLVSHISQVSINSAQDLDTLLLEGRRKNSKKIEGLELYRTFGPSGYFYAAKIRSNISQSHSIKAIDQSAELISLANLLLSPQIASLRQNFIQEKAGEILAVEESKLGSEDITRIFARASRATLQATCEPGITLVVARNHAADLEGRVLAYKGSIETTSCESSEAP